MTLKDWVGWVLGSSGWVAFFYLLWSRRTCVNVRAHRALMGVQSRLCWFVNVTNMNHTQSIEITHVWLETPNGQMHMNAVDRPLPRIIGPGSSWETWVAVEDMPQNLRSDNTFEQFRVRLSNGTVITPKLRKADDLPDSGAIPG